MSLRDIRGRKIYKSAAALLVADAASKGANVIIALLIARYLGPALFGKYASASAVCGLFMLITGIGFEQEFTRRGGIDEADIPQNLRANFTALIITSIIAYTGMSILFFWGIYEKEVALIGLLLGAAYIAMRFHLPFRHLCLLLNKTKITAIFQSISTILIIALTLGIIFLRGDLIDIALSQLVVAVCLLFSWFIWVPKKHIADSQEPGILAAFFKNSIPFAVSNIIWIAYFNFDTFMLSLLRSESEVGIYAGVYRIIGVNYLIGYAVTNTFTPILFEKYRKNKVEFNAISRKLVITLWVLGTALGSCLYFLSDLIIPGIVGKEYVGGIGISKILSIAVLFRLLNFGLCEILTTSDRQTKRIYMEIAMLVMNIIVNFILIPTYGGTGAALATLSAEVILFIAAFISYKKRISIP